MLTKEDVKAAIKKWPSRYQTKDNRIFLGETVSGMPTSLRNAGWKNVSRFDEHDFKKMGLEIVEARYVGGVRAKRFCQVIVMEWI